MKQSFRVNYLRQLCTLDVAESALMPVVLEELSTLLDLDMCCFNWTTHDGILSHAHTAGLIPPHSIVERYVAHYVNRDEAELGVTTQQLAHRPHARVGSHLLGSRFKETILYNEILKPIDLRYILNTGVFAGEHMLSTLSCNRMADHKEFSPADMRRLEQLLPYLGMAASVRASGNEEWSEYDERGVLVVDKTGAIQHADSLGINRLYRATRNTVRPNPVVEIDDWMLAPLRTLSQRLLWIEDDLPSPPPEMVLLAEGRRFSLKARSLRASPNVPLDLIVVSVSEWVPRTLQVLPWLRLQGLSERQRALSLLLMKGGTLREAACQLGISLNTAQCYLDVIYAKLGIKSRDELLVRLHAAKAPANIY